MKTRTAASSGVKSPCFKHEGMRFHSTFTWRDTSCIPTWLWRQLGLDVEDYACATRSSLPGRWFHAGTSSRSAFTWDRNAFSYRNENLAPVQWPGWTRTSMARSWVLVWSKLEVATLKVAASQLSIKTSWICMTVCGWKAKVYCETNCGRFTLRVVSLTS